MTVTLTDTEALEYLEYLEKKQSFIETKSFIDRLIDIREELKPQVFRLAYCRDVITWEKAVEEVDNRAERLNGLLTKTINRLTAYNAEHRKEQNNGRNDVKRKAEAEARKRNREESTVQKRLSEGDVVRIVESEYDDPVDFSVEYICVKDEASNGLVELTDGKNTRFSHASKLELVCEARVKNRKEQK